MTKDEALKMAIEAMQITDEAFTEFSKGLVELGIPASILKLDKQSRFIPAIQTCKEALERPTNMVAVPADQLEKMQQELKQLRKQPTQEPVAWINVKDKLPKETGRYLVYVEAIHDLGNVHYIWNAGFNPNNRVFQEETMEGATVTHWMNLPNTPNGISHYIDPSHPAQSWQELSDDEIETIMFGKNGTYFNFARAIEKALKEKNT